MKTWKNIEFKSMIVALLRVNKNYLLDKSFKMFDTFPHHYLSITEVVYSLCGDVAQQLEQLFIRHAGSQRETDIPTLSLEPVQQVVEVAKLWI